MDYQFLQLEQNNQVATVWINRAELHNAFNTEVIEELHACFQTLNSRDDIRVVILAGRGKSFSAGADLNWMKQAGQASTAENQADALKLAKMLQSLATLKQPTIARVHGIAFGGGMGLAAACDICVASTDAKFATSEVRLGLAPSTISPYVIRAIGARQASRYFLTAERISAEQAQQIGLAHEVAAPEQLDSKIDDIVQALLLGGPDAQHASKQLIQMVNQQVLTEDLLQQTAQHIAHIRQGDEAKNGLNAFLNKQSPAWIKTTA
ncbi:enoyl-CoA hydratase/isomerase family protein [Acinetobacter towneri]|uniref:enoyl-CoA hydratase/isomerase family protein n=1 Tax=Acinetobacter towneri TaxID=202956 RepID=UPI001CE1F335|nr:enoyl-CoA hydratase/isomerase family protein [Acinetobacter towneri]MCA4779091.1 enoyl-CoA hydratase/isomerase family protein [Acinetobacter towneri]MCA4784387.1 enoyl-CoA hydratase/isomerase family protein [Acinetobacter towneri]MCA4787580.1 enoyl-CoA hydratase/isomerase family protein [Acinetobacter towneri]MCA4795606.1 enoyl-CoA hydratase/isomerase family protein [Acinetobacter towneri]MCA4800619.1 enoyl-CoA hydratase/isomerase family protein [Acinetobacter towneri]